MEDIKIFQKKKKKKNTIWCKLNKGLSEDEKNKLEVLQKANLKKNLL